MAKQEQQQQEQQQQEHEQFTVEGDAGIGEVATAILNRMRAYLMACETRLAVGIPGRITFQQTPGNTFEFNGPDEALNFGKRLLALSKSEALPITRFKLAIEQIRSADDGEQSPYRVVAIAKLKQSSGKPRNTAKRVAKATGWMATYAKALEPAKQ